MEMEKVESSIRNWSLATFDNKLEVDANYKRMVEYGMRYENIKAVHLGIASHNLFELAFAFKLAEARGIGNCFTYKGNLTISLAYPFSNKFRAGSCLAPSSAT